MANNIITNNNITDNTIIIDSLSTSQNSTNSLPFYQNDIGDNQQYNFDNDFSVNINDTSFTMNDHIIRNQQTVMTFEWLHHTFQFRPGVSISRSLIYETYLIFCQQHNFIPVCKATFGKLVRNRFPGVKSKRLGARGQSKYHYYNINFKENSKINGTLLNSNENSKTYTESAPSFACNNKSSSKPLTILSQSESKRNSHGNDHHFIIQLMLSFMRLPQDQLYNNDEFIFTNLYKTHCQCLLDAALCENYGQMRHYIMHFWQQLPPNIVIYVNIMKSLDSYMYSLLCQVYLSPNSSDENLKHINTIGYVMYVWMRNIFNNNWNIKWKLNSNRTEFDDLNTIKIQDALKWHFKIKFVVNFIASLKKLDFTLLPDSLDHLAEKMIETNLIEQNYYLFDKKDCQQIISQLIVEEFCQLKMNHDSTHQTSSLLIDQLDQMIKRIEDRYFDQCFFNNKTDHRQHEFAQNLSIEFNHLFSQINRLEMFELDINSTFIDDENQESMISDITTDDSFDDDYMAKLDAQSYLILMIINDYILLVCQSING
ncbi:DNA-binding protein rfx6 [Dermatophagoides farinae]|uniref:DNA-binding protein rfx6 n=1 Tax=Dermatophagoides farinae TaxID=6954 RepID=A0A922HXY4_DERFA|nr:DNA-binding protein rfx6 [Dermatophagoides farinae]